MGFYLFVIFLTQFISSGCQMLSVSSTRICEERKYENSEIEILRLNIIRLQEEKSMQDDRLNLLENRIITLESMNEKDSRSTTDEIRMNMFQKKLDVIEQNLEYHDAIFDDLNKQNMKFDDKLNSTSNLSMDLYAEHNKLLQEVEENERNMKSEIADQRAGLIKMETLLQRRTENIRNETKMQIMFLNTTVSRIRLLTDDALLNISLIARQLKSKNASNKLEENLSQTKKMVTDTQRDVHSLNLTILSLENKISRQNEELEMKVFEFFNATYTDSMDSFNNEVKCLQQRDRNYSSHLSAISAWESNITESLQRLEQSLSVTTNSITCSSLQNRIASLERNNFYNLSTINGIHKWMANLKSGYRQLVRLVNGGSSYGRLEVNLDGEGWGNVCDDNFEVADANVVCRQLGYSSGVVKASAYYGQGSLTILMDDVGCLGSELAIQHCKYIGKTGENCGHSEDVGVVCS